MSLENQLKEQNKRKETARGGIIQGLHLFVCLSMNASVKIEFPR